MERFLKGFLLYSLIFFAYSVGVFASPIVMGKEQASAEAKKGSGSGLCGSTSHFLVVTPPSGINDAISILNKPKNDLQIQDRISKLFSNPVNFRNTNSVADGDFAGTGYLKTFFPYSNDPNTIPNGDNQNIAMRLRGYFNVPATIAGKTITFAIRCDDGCRLRIGKSAPLVFDEVKSATGSLAKRQVTFTDSGMYPVELIYYQNTDKAILEWSYAASVESEDPKVPLDTTKFVPLSPAQLDAGLIVANPACQECEASNTCNTGSYCQDGLCQFCNIADHCGPTCVQCSGNRNICNAGVCVECTMDSQCAKDLSCNNGTCTPPVPCKSTAECSSFSKVCDANKGFCIPAPIPCRTDAECVAGQICDLNSRNSVCIDVPSKGGCTVGNSSTPQSELLILVGVILFGLGLKRKALFHFANRILSIRK